MVTTDRSGQETPGSQARRTQAERRASSERRLLNAAAKLIGERGTTAVSFADIAREAGCSHGLPSYLFGSKTNLMLALVDNTLDLFRRQVLEPAVTDAGGEPGLDAVLSAIGAFLRSLRDPWAHTRALYVLIGEWQGAPDELKTALAEHHEAARELIRTSIQASQERGEVRADADADAAAVAILGALRGIGLQALMEPSAIDVDAVTRFVTDGTRRLLQA